MEYCILIGMDSVQHTELLLIAPRVCASPVLIPTTNPKPTVIWQYPTITS